MVQYDKDPLPPDLKRALRAAQRLTVDTESVVDLFTPTSHRDTKRTEIDKRLTEIAPHIKTASRKQERRIGAQMAESLCLSLERRHRHIMNVSLEITAVNQKPFFTYVLCDTAEIAANAHLAALGVAMSLIEVIVEVYFNDVALYRLSHLLEMHKVYPIAPRLCINYRKFEKQVRSLLDLQSLPDWDELRGRLIVEASTTANARRQQHNSRKFLNGEASVLPKDQDKARDQSRPEAIAPDEFRFRGQSVHDLSALQWRLLSALCDKNGLRSAVPIQEVIGFVYGLEEKNRQSIEKRRRSFGELRRRLQVILDRADIPLLIELNNNFVRLLPIR